MVKLFDNLEHEGNSNLKLMISCRLLNIPSVTLYCTALTGILKNRDGNPIEDLSKVLTLKLEPSAAKIYMIWNDTSK